MSPGCEGAARRKRWAMIMIGGDAARWCDKAMIAPEQTDIEDWPAEVDPIAVALCPLIAAVFELTADGSAERALAMGEVLQVAGRIRAALRRPTIN
jgi:hypothetical protein